MRILIVACALAISACSTNPAPDTAAAPTREAQRTDTQAADISAMRHLTSVLIDASTLYRAAADEADNQAYAQQIRALSDHRRAMADQFQTRVSSIGGAAPETGEALGTAHRALMEARLLGGNDTKVAVEEALRGENYLLDELTTASNNTELSGSTRTFLSSQIAGVRSDRDRLNTYAETLG